MHWLSSPSVHLSDTARQNKSDLELTLDKATKILLDWVENSLMRVRQLSRGKLQLHQTAYKVNIKTAIS